MLEAEARRAAVTAMSRRPRVFRPQPQKIKCNVPLNELPRTLVISGGGLKAFYLLGSLSRLHDEGLLSHVSRYAGTSVGSMISVCLALGFSPLEIVSQALSLPSLKNRHCPTVAEFVNIMINSAKKSFVEIVELLADMMDGIGIGRDATFTDFYKFTGGKSLLVVATRLSSYDVNEAVFSTKRTPDMPVLTAVRMSCSVPIVVDPVCLDDCLFVDGCLVNNFPVDRAVDEWLDGGATLALGIDKGRKIVHTDSVTYLMIPIHKKYGEGLICSSADRFEMYYHGRNVLGPPRRRYTM